MKMLVQKLGFIQTNCYLLVEENSGACAVIDPGSAQPSLFSQLEQAGVNRLDYILLTHGHFDHILGVYALKQRYPEAVIAIHADDAACLTDACESRAENYIPGRQQAVSADRILQDGDTLPFAGKQNAFRVLHTPGHTRGGVCYLYEEERWLFSGDTLFLEDVGRTDFPGGSREELRRSLLKLDQLPGDWAVFPGHEESTTLEHERRYNPEWNT